MIIMVTSSCCGSAGSELVDVVEHRLDHTLGGFVPIRHHHPGEPFVAELVLLGIVRLRHSVRKNYQRVAARQLQLLNLVRAIGEEADR